MIYDEETQLDEEKGSEPSLKTLRRIAEKELPDFLAYGLGATEVEQRPDGWPEPLLFGSLEQLMKEDAAVADRLLYLLDVVREKLIDLGATPFPRAVEKVLGDDEVRISEGRMRSDEEEHRN